MSVKVRRDYVHPLDAHLSALGVTRSEFQKVSGLSKAYVLRLSQGRASGFSDTVIGAIQGLYGDRGLTIPSPEDLRKEWNSWVTAHRRGQDDIPAPLNAGGSPWEGLVSAIGGVCRTAAFLAVPDVVVERYRRTAHMPIDIELALHDMGYPHIIELGKAQQKYVEGL